MTIIPTIGFNVETIDMGGTSICCWDVGGCDKIRPLWRFYTEGINAFVFVVDSHDRDRIEDASNELHLFLNDETMVTRVPLVVLANKQDMPTSMGVAEIIHRLNLNNITNRV